MIVNVDLIGLYPQITISTGIATLISTIIGKIFTSLVKVDLVANIIIDDMSDHLLILFFVVDTKNYYKD